MAFAFAFALIVAVLILIAAGWIAWVSVQSVLQARVLSKPLKLYELKDNLEKPVALRGRPEPRKQISAPDGAVCIWYRYRQQVYRRRGKNSSWCTVAEDVRSCPFELHFPGGGRVMVQNEATEVSGTSSCMYGGGFMEYSRDLHDWLPADVEVTVMGRILLSGEGATVAKDQKIGMILTTRSPGYAAAVEYAKGFGGFAAAAAMAAVAIYFMGMALRVIT